MMHILKSRRHIAHLGAGALAAFLTVLGACNSADRLSPTVEAPTATESTPDFSTGAVAPGIVFASFGMETSLLNSVHTGTIRQPDRCCLLPLLSGIRAKGGRIVIKLSGNDKYAINGDGTFNLTKWKTLVARFKGINFSSYIADGTILGHFLLDEPYLASRWGGKQVPQSTVEAMAKYSKQLWPTMTTMIQATPRWLAGAPVTYVYLDAGWAQYQSAHGSASSWIGKEVAAAKTKGLGLVVGLNGLDGGNGSSGFRGHRSDRWAMSAAELKSYGSALLAQSYACGFVMWQYSSTYYGRSNVKSSMAALSTQAKNHTRTSCRHRLRAGDVVSPSGPSGSALPAPPPVSHAGYYVAPTGSPTGDGSATRPWDLATALAQPAAVQPGDTIWLRGGTYSGTFTSTLTGTAANPIIVRQYPGERATIVRNGTASLTVNGAYTWYWGFEVANTDVTTVDVPGFNVFGPGTKLINLVVHDQSGNGIGIWEMTGDGEVHGCIVYNNGFKGGYGSGVAHGIYTQNLAPYMRLLTDNIIFNQFGFDIHAYGEAGHEQNTTLDGNVVWGPGYGITLRTHGVPISGIVVKQNMLWDWGGGGFKLGAPMGNYNDHGYQDLTFTDNYAYGSETDLGNWTTLVNTGNSFLGHYELRIQIDGSSWPTAPAYVWNKNAYVSIANRPIYTTYFGANQNPGQYPQNWPGYSGYDLNSTFTNTTYGKPATNRVFVRPNQYEPGRANVVVFNWQHLASVAVDLSGVLRAGDQYVIQNAQDFYGAPVASGTYGGGPITLPMAAVPPPTPIAGWRGGIPSPPTGPEFNAFVVLRTRP